MDALHDVASLWLQPAFTLWGSPITWTELLACVLSLWMVGCNMRVHPLGWPLAIVSSLLYAALFLHYRLYGEASLQLIFVALAGWGWWEWLKGRGEDGQRLTVHRLGGRARLRAALLTATAWPLLGLLLHRMTDSDVPFLDALPTVGSVAGQILLGRKLIENWPVWIAVNLVSVGLFAYKGLWLTVLLYALFAGLAAWGWRRWQALEGQVRG
ncbi:nicotinamide riboside transporter PnuC [Ideonella oryzae]|uniref:Nicotinamide riboside transporter PnuC n=1 Tax=Ideonella oryzae TaxID=2937441 RepID=A0ABT1BM02_9BURK|nr:nicotinamide riboside transporter PnuC [Ideonella oryzae]MCO5976616.1 nicotinamide riboside transporter PnuC [Ideonella oryzae]